MFKVGLTGGIGCGKTTVSQLFTELNIPVVDADTIAYQVVQPGQPVLSEICKVFGEKTLNLDGSLNRNYIRDIVFTDKNQKQKLEAILHPLIFSTMKTQIAQFTSPYCIASIPLLFETEMTNFVDRILVVDCPIETQIARVKSRNNLSEARIRAIIDSQVSREYRITHADNVITNNDTNAGLAEQVKKLHNLYLSISLTKGKIGS